MSVDNVRRACTETLILALLKDGPMHGYMIAKAVEQRSSGYFVLKHATLYPILHRLEKDGVLASEWVTDREGEKPRRYYELTKKGRQRRDEDALAWRDFIGALAQLVPEVAR